MSAEILRKAAALMRERAEYAPDAPWSADVRQSGMSWVRFRERDDDVAMHGYPAAARHIASWHPAVALAVADWLDDVLREHDSGHGRYQLTGDPMGWTGEMRSALAVARAYLGGDE